MFVCFLFFVKQETVPYCWRYTVRLISHVVIYGHKWAAENNWCKYSKLCQQLTEGETKIQVWVILDSCAANCQASRLNSPTGGCGGKREIIISSEVLLLLPILPLSVPQPTMPPFFAALVQQDQVGLVRLAAVVVVILQTKRTGPSSGPSVGGKKQKKKRCLELEPPGEKWPWQNAIGLLQRDSEQVYHISVQAASAFYGLVYQTDGWHWSEWSRGHSVCSNRHCNELVILGALSKSHQRFTWLKFYKMRYHCKCGKEYLNICKKASRLKQFGTRLNKCFKVTQGTGRIESFKSSLPSLNIHMRRAGSHMKTSRGAHHFYKGFSFFAAHRSHTSIQNRNLGCKSSWTGLNVTRAFRRETFPRLWHFCQL